MVCNGAGGCVPCTAGVACTTNPNQCANGVTSCATGATTCVDGASKSDGTGCNDGMACTANDACKSGACVGSGPRKSDEAGPDLAVDSRRCRWPERCCAEAA